MTDATIRHADDIESTHGVFKRVRRELGVTAFGVNLEQFPAGHQDYPEHDHLKDGQEELYVVLEGSGTVTIDGEPHEVRKGHLVRVGPGTKRKLIPGPDGIQVLAIGGVPGQPYPVPS